MGSGRTGAGFASAAIRNIGIIAHIDAGKTSISERFLFHSGKNHKIGDIDEGSTTFDYLEEEKRRGITIVSAAASFEWKTRGTSYIYHLIDTPGHIDFTAEVERSLRVIDGAVLVFSAVEGVQAQSEKVWRQSDVHKVPKIAFINKLDRTGASYRRVFDDIAAKFKSKIPLPLQIPMGEEGALAGIIDLVEMRALRFGGENGEELCVCAIPDEYSGPAASWRERLLENVSTLSDRVLSLFVDGKSIDADLLRSEIRQLAIAGSAVPVFCGSAKRNIGIQTLLDAVSDYLPSPLESPRLKGKSPKTGEEIEISGNEDFFCGLVFKLDAGDSSDLLYLRSYSGKLRVNDTLLNSRTMQKVKVKRLLRLYASNIEAVSEVEAGDIVGVCGPSDTFTGDTLCSVARPIALESIIFPEPVMSVSIEPKSSKEKEKLEACLAALAKEDPTFAYRRSESGGQIIVSGMGELHLEVKTRRICEDFKVQARVGIPQVAFRETLRERVEANGNFQRLIGEQIFSASVQVEFSPIPPLTSSQPLEIFAEKELTRQFPGEWISCALNAIGDGLKTGGNYSYPLIYVRAVMKSLSAGDPATAASSISAACLDAVRKALDSGTKILEPIVKIEIMCPEDRIGDISSYLQSKRGVIAGIDALPDVSRLVCDVPLSEMLGFSKALPKISSGRASFSMEPAGYCELEQK